MLVSCHIFFVRALKNNIAQIAVNILHQALINNGKRARGHIFNFFIQTTLAHVK